MKIQIIFIITYSYVPVLNVLVEDVNVMLQLKSNWSLMEFS